MSVFVRSMHWATERKKARSVTVVSFCLLAWPVAAAQWPTTGRAGGIVTGVVWDSISKRQLLGATVQLVTADTLAPSARTATSDSLGRFTFDSVAAGRYRIGFLHPLLDSLGLQPRITEVSVDGHEAVNLTLALPSSSSVRFALCGPSHRAGGVFVGSALTASGRKPIVGATISAHWAELTFGGSRVAWRLQNQSGTTGEDGWFALCGIPESGTVAVALHLGTDSTDTVELDVPAGGLLRRDLFLGGGKTANVSGEVRAALDLHPESRARVKLANVGETAADTAGLWTLSAVPLGTRTLEVRAVRYYPTRTAVDVFEAMPHLTTRLSQLKAVMDTIRVTARANSDRHLSGFDQRRRSAVGRFLTASEISRQRSTVTSELLRGIPRVELLRTDTGTVIRFPGTFRDACTPRVYLNAKELGEMSADLLDDLVSPHEIAGMEIYTGAGTPPQFSKGLGGGCGVIVIWTK
jgi:hypothetical protein